MKKKVLVISGALAIIAAAIFTIFCIVNYYKEDTTQDPGQTNQQPATKREVAYVNKDAETSDITKVEGITNIYIFWGNGCPHCKSEWEYIESIRKEYANTFQVFGFEIWYDHGNRELAEKFAYAVGDEEITAVPYIVIGGKSYTGTLKGDAFFKAIDEAKKSKIDLYFDDINRGR